MVFALYQLQAYYLNEIKRGLSGLGEYHLKLVYISVAVNPHAIEYLPTHSPQDIVLQIRERGIQQDQTSEPPVRVKEETEESSRGTYKNASLVPRPPTSFSLLAVWKSGEGLVYFLV